LKKTNVFRISIVDLVGVDAIMKLFVQKYFSDFFKGELKPFSPISVNLKI
jgi:hypothetical protein